MSTPLGYVIYRGASRLDGAPIVVIVTGLRASTNIKTGRVLQTWILRSDLSPTDAIRAGADSSICGDCLHRGDPETGRKRSCYVLEFQAPLAVWRAWRRGAYEDITGDWEQISQACYGRIVRLGSYGDPAAVPDVVWAAALTGAPRWSGYTHQWRGLPQGALLRVIAMASVDSPEEAAEAQADGWRTFRVGYAPPGRGEISCPASKEAGERTTCADCGLCAGSYREARNITIRPHGSRGRQLAVAQ